MYFDLYFCMQRDGRTLDTALRTIEQEVLNNGINEKETFTDTPDPVRLCHLLA